MRITYDDETSPFKRLTAKSPSEPMHPLVRQAIVGLETHPMHICPLESLLIVEMHPSSEMLSLC